MTQIHPSLSKAARRNLKAICREFERCSRYYPPLYHQRMWPWSEEGPDDMSLPEWEAFRRIASDQLDAQDWWQWDEPSWRSGNYARVRFGEDGDLEELGSTSEPVASHYPGLWFGDGEGLEEFANLSESVAMVLSQEAPDFDPLDFNLCVDHGSDWLVRLHEWAFRYQLPLLRSEMTLWGAEDHELQEFYELAEQWETLEDGTKVPRHPVVWRLVDNVFTSSMAAIRAILRSDAVIATNEPWPLSTTPPLFQPFVLPDEESVSDQKDPDSKSGNSIHYDGLYWRVRYELDEKEGVLKGYEGPFRLALVLSRPHRFFEYHVLSQRRHTVSLDALKETDDGVVHYAGKGVSANDKADPEWAKATEKTLLELASQIKDAESQGDHTTASALRLKRDEVKKYRRSYLNSKGQSRKESSDWKQDSRTVRKSMQETVERIARQMPNLGRHLTDCINYDECVIYDPVPPHVWEIDTAHHRR